MLTKDTNELVVQFESEHALVTRVRELVRLEIMASLTPINYQKYI